MVYLIHFTEPLAHARHYTGWTPDDNLDNRLSDHRSGRGARITQVAVERGIGLELSRTWQGGRTRERQLKNQGGASRHCPTCKAKGTEPTFTLEEINRDLYGR